MTPLECADVSRMVSMHKSAGAGLVIRKLGSLDRSAIFEAAGGFRPEQREAVVARWLIAHAEHKGCERCVAISTTATATPKEGAHAR